MMGGPPPGPMPHNGPPGNYGGGPQRGGYHGGMGRDRQNGPPRFNERGYQNDSGRHKHNAACFYLIVIILAFRV